MNLKKYICTVVLFIGFISMAKSAQLYTESWNSNSLCSWQIWDNINEKYVPNNGGWFNDSIFLRFNCQWISLPPETYFFKAPIDTNVTIFVGNYLDAGINAVEFKIKPEMDTQIKFLIHNDAAYSRWFCNISNLQTGIWNTVKVPLSFSNLVNYSSSRRNKEALVQDLQNVSWVAVSIVRNQNMKQQFYYLDDFKLLGDTNYVNYIKTLAQTNIWLTNMLYDEEYNIGTNNYLSYQTYLDSTSPFRVRIAYVNGLQLLKWESKTNSIYRIYRYKSIMSLNSTNSSNWEIIADDISGNPPENTFECTNDCGGYYKVLRVK